MSSREDILGRLRGSLGRTAENAASGRAAIDACLAAHERGPRSRLADDLLMRFKEKSQGLASTLDEVAMPDQVPGAVARYLTAHGLPRQAVCWPELAGPNWRAADMRVEPRPACGEDLVGITGCFAAVAETGTLVLCSGASTPAATSLLPETHIAVLPASRVVADMESVWRLLRGEPGGLPRAVNFVSGPSRTGDIEQTIVLGAHGPYRVHIVIVTSA